ncbi:ATP-binding protein [Streptomyces sp. NA02950]|uniref:ATP-binding protein n=1 Tax=Streptomyces sp. NA02950 TaxID=2742137 RepID=UPI0015926050|nr:ATP-binding protein [Streptomyces sp. NA02950]QKV95946.1 ATP-binding protein [Streptomyces sp. NA02950]
MIGAAGEGQASVWRWNSRSGDAAVSARVALRSALAQLGLPDGAVCDVTRAAWELTANAMEHACGPYEMRLQRKGASLVFEIEDGDPRIPATPPAVPSGGEFEVDGDDLDSLIASLSEDGRGLRIVDQITGGQWGFRPSRSGIKAAWMVISDPPKG